MDGKVRYTIRIVVRLFFFIPILVSAAGSPLLPDPYSQVSHLYPFDDFGWFREQKQQVIKKLLEEKEARVVVELGSFLGKSTRFIASHLPAQGRIYAVDHWLGSPEHQSPGRVDVYPKLSTLYERFLSNVIHAGLCDKVIPVQATTKEALLFIEEEPDLVFVDASHEYEEVLVDLENWYERLKDGGILCGDDWAWGGPDYPVKRAVQDFATRHHLQCFVDGAIWWMYR